MKKSCIVGFGAIGPYHAKIFNDFPFAELYAICDIDDKRLEKAAKAHPEVKLFKDYNDVLADSNIDVIHICTPHYLHCEMVEKALLAGRMFCLKNRFVSVWKSLSV